MDRMSGIVDLVKPMRPGETAVIYDGGILKCHIKIQFDKLIWTLHWFRYCQDSLIVNDDVNVVIDDVNGDVDDVKVDNDVYVKV